VVISTDSSGSSVKPYWKTRTATATAATDAAFELVEQRERAHLLDTRRRRLSEQLELAQARSDAIATAATARGDWQRRRYAHTQNDLPNSFVKIEFLAMIFLKPSK
jgi:hypothetical protein